MAEIKNNIVDLEVVYSKLNATIDRNIDLLKEGATAVDVYNKKISVVPSEFQKSLTDIKTKTDAVTKSTTDLTAVEKERIRVEKQLEQTTAKISIANEKNTQTLVAKKTELRALNSAYLQLSQREAESARRVQDLIARGRTATQTQRQYNQELRTAQREFDKYRAKVLQADQAVGRWNRTGERSIGFMRNLIGAFGIAGGVTLFATIERDIFQTTKELQSLDNALMQVSGTQEQFSRSQEFLRDISERFGLEINGLTKQFTQFYVSAKDKLSANEIEGIFTSISKAGSVMGLSVENQERAFLALNQMMSKGTVQAEELRGQLGEALPGAFGIMAKAVGVTEKELQNMMKAGEVLADEVLPKFAKQLEKTYRIETINRVETLSASQNRLSNSWTELVRSLNESETGGISVFFKTLVDGLNSVLNLLIEANKSFADFKKSVYQSSKSNIAENISKSARENAQAIISGQLRRGKKPDNIDELTRIKEIEYASAELTRQKAKYIQALKDEEGAEIALNIQKEKSKSLITGGIFNLSNLNKAEKKHQEAILYTQQIRGNIDGLMLVVNKKEEENTKAVIENTGSTNKNTKAKKENKKAKDDVRFALIGSVEWFEKLKSALEEEQKQLSQNSEKWQDYQKRIDQVQKSIDAITKASKELDGVSLDLGGSEFITDEEGDAIMKAGDELRALLKEFKQGFIDEFADQSGFSGFLGILQGDLEKFEGDAISTALAVSEAFQQAFNTISEASQANFDAEYARLEEQKDFAIEMAGGSATAREEIEKQYEERKKAIQRREAEAQKRLAIFNIVTNTAQAILATYAKVGFPAGIPLAIAMGAIGAFQVGLVASQEIPQFWKGTDNAPEGLAWTQEKGAEVITDKNGNVKTLGSDKGAQLTYLSKGDKVYKSHEDYINKVLSKNGISDLGSYMNFAPKMEINNGITKEDLDQNFSKLASVIKNKDGVNISIDERGFRKKQGNTEFINSRLNLTSRQV